MAFELQGRMMSLHFLRVREQATVREIIARLRETKSSEDILFLCAVDDDGRLAGVIPIEQLLLATESLPLQAVARKPAVAVTPEMSQDDVARTALACRAWRIAVVDQDGRPLGVIRVRDVIQTILERNPKGGSRRHRLERIIQPSRTTRRSPATCYRLDARYADADPGSVRALITRSIDPERMRLASFEIAKVPRAGAVAICAELIALERDDRVMEQVAWRLGLEPGLQAVRWAVIREDGNPEDPT
jgi:CBS domain-containing protein